MESSVRVSEERLVVAGSVPAESPVSAISWAAIIGGAFAIAAIGLILLALGAGLGFASVSPWSNSGPSATTFTVAAAIWLIVVQWLSAAFGGYFTGRLRTKWVSMPSDEIYFRDTAHGFLAWAVAAVFTVAVVASATSSLIGGTARAVGTAAASATQSTPEIAPVSSGSALDPTAYLVNELVRSDQHDLSGNLQARAEVTPVVAHALSEGGIPAADKTYLSQLVVARTGLSQPDAAKRVDDVDGQVKAAWVKARQAADQARKAASYLSFFTAFSMLVGAFIAAVAATIAGHRRDEMLARRHRI
jgi:disulfide bond formation protein DsbB